MPFWMRPYTHLFVASQEVADADAKHGLASAAVEAAARLAELDLGTGNSVGRPRRAGGGGVAGYLAGKRAGLGALVAAFGISSSRAGTAT